MDTTQSSNGHAVHTVGTNPQNRPPKAKLESKSRAGRATVRRRRNRWLSLRDASAAVGLDPRWLGRFARATHIVSHPHLYDAGQKLFSRRAVELIVAYAELKRLARGRT